jgi:hypothetical protein
MGRLRQSDVSRLVDCLRVLYEVCDIDTFPQRVVTTLPRLVASDITSYNEVDPRRQRIAFVADPPGSLSDLQGKGLFEPHIPEHPLIAWYERTRDGRALKISDFLSQRQFRRLGLYQEFYRRVDVGRCCGTWAEDSHA